MRKANVHEHHIRFSNWTRHVQLIYILSLVSFGLAACSLDVEVNRPPSEITPVLEVQDRKSPDFTYGEIVTTYGGTPGFEVKAVFGEISEKTKSLNGNQWEIEGVFYE